jgi:hypothetical protein
MIYRLPSGNHTSNANYYVRAWKAAARPITKKTGWKLVAFNPDFQFMTQEKLSVSLPLWAVKDLSKNKE